MFTLHMLSGGRKGLADAIVSVGVAQPGTSPLRVYDLGLGEVIRVAPADLVAVASAEPAGVSFAPLVAAAETRAAANKKVIPIRRRRAAIPEDFQTGYTAYARPAALFWRDHAVGAQPLLAAGVFSLSSIQTPIVTALKLFRGLMPFVIDNRLPKLDELTAIVRRSGAGLDSPKSGRPRWYLEYDAYRHTIARTIDDGQRDDVLRSRLAMGMAMPLGLGLAKLSFTLALVGNNLGCLDARIIKWAFTAGSADAFTRRIARKRPDGSYSRAVYADYRRAEQRILGASPFYDPHDPVGLARAQWLLWEALGAEATAHTHEEIFAAVQEPAILATL